jgi:hypothetical protein
MNRKQIQVNNIALKVIFARKFKSKNKRTIISLFAKIGLEMKNIYFVDLKTLDLSNFF